MDNYLTIIQKYLEGTISMDERKALKKWLSNDAANKDFFKKGVREWYVNKRTLKVDSDKAYKDFVSKIDKKRSKEMYLDSWVKPLAYAAVFAGVLLGLYHFIPGNTISRSQEGVPQVVSVDSKITDKIKIVQGDGTVSYMDFNSTADVANTEGTIIGKKDKDQFVLENSSRGDELSYMEVTIPKGKMFQLVLSDGTKVWLNAASSLKFPRQFLDTEKNRLVYLEGEAFFDVETNKQKPFIVKTGQMDVKVLGTQFNVSSYPEDPVVKTTLVEGAVSVNNENNLNVLQLTPNYQAVFDKENNTLGKKMVDTDIFTAWMHRKLVIKNEAFATIKKRIERTYDVEITSNNDKLNQTKFTGEFDLENVRQILNVFSETLDFKYTMENKKITIHP